jgi:hypothetical protein
MKEHFAKWGWVSFLSYIAESKVFDIAGIDSIESAKRARLYPVLVWASEKKDKEEAVGLYYESLNKNR